MSPTLRLALVFLWLLPCAWYDWRTRRVPNVLTVPAFFLAWPVALWRGPEALFLTALVFGLSYLGWRVGWTGGADVKAYTFVTALAPEALMGTAPLYGLLVVRNLARGGVGRTFVPGLAVLAGGAALAWLALLILTATAFRVY